MNELVGGAVAHHFCETHVQLAAARAGFTRALAYCCMFQHVRPSYKVPVIKYGVSTHSVERNSIPKFACSHSMIVERSNARSNFRTPRKYKCV